MFSTCKAYRSTLVMCGLGSIVAAPALAQKKPTLLLKSTLNKKRSQLKLSAKRLAFAPRGCLKCPAKLELSGAVSVTAGDLTVKADRVTVWLEASTRRAYRVEARGRIQLKHGRRTGSANRLDLRTRGGGELELQGAAALRCPGLGLTLQGERIVFQLETGKVTVDHARAQLQPRSHR